MKTCRHPTCSDECRRPLTKKPRKPINKVSKKQVTRNRQYNILATAFKKMFPLCQAKLTGCEYRTVSVHHKKGRLGNNLLDVSTFLATCENCHRVIENKPKFAKVNGLSESRLNKSA